MGRTLKRRRHEARTDYRSRLELLKSNKIRAVIRKTNRYVNIQFVQSINAQDKVIVGTTSKDLLNMGWPVELSGSLKSRPASYLAGLLAGKKAKDKVKEAVLDLGMHRNISKSRIYSALKGIIDAGIKVPHDEKILPTEDEISKNNKGGKIIAQIKQKINNG